MNLYKLHNEPRTLDGYDEMDKLENTSIKETEQTGATYKNVFGELNRPDGPAYITAAGSEFWYRFGKKHRENGPAVIYDNGTKFWYIDGELHRTDGPAVIYDGNNIEYWINGKQVDELI